MRTLGRGEIWLGVLLVLGLAVGIYARSLDGAFQFDDQTSIVENESLRRGPLDWWRYWPTRALTITTLGLDWRRAGLDPAPYHHTNVALQGLLALASLSLLWQLLSDRAPARRRWWCAVLGACCYAAHPLLVQSVAYIVQRAASLLALFSFACIALYLHAARTAARRAIWTLAAWFCGLAACVAKEPAIALSPALLLVDFCCLPALGRWRRWLPFAVLATLPPLLLVASGGALGNDRVGLLAQATTIDRWSYLWTQTEVVARYLGLAIWPAGLNIDHDIAWRHTPFSLAWFGYAALHATLLSVAWLAWRRGHQSVAGAIAWIYLLLLPESSLFPIEDAMFEHRMLLALLGVVWLFCLGLLAAPLRWRRLAVVVPLLLALVTVQRVELWRDPLALWQDALAKSPDKARPHMAVGWLLGRAGDLTRARDQLLEAVRLDPDYAMAWNNLGVVAMRLADYPLAERSYAEAIRLHPEQAVLWSNRGHARLRVGDRSGAQADFEAALRIDPHFASAQQGLLRLQAAATSERSED